jgi:serine protease Do
MQPPYNIGSTPEQNGEAHDVSPLESPRTTAPETAPQDATPISPSNWQAGLDAPTAQSTVEIDRTSVAPAEMPAPVAPAETPLVAPVVPSVAAAQSTPSVPVTPTPVAPAPQRTETIHTETVRVASMNPLAAMLGGGVLACACVALGAFLGARNASTGDSVTYSGVSPQSGNAIVNAVRTVGPSVMNVDTEFSRPRGTGEFLPNPAESTQPQRGKGTGVVIDSKQGLMLTNAHVVAGAQSIRVTTRDGKQYSGRLLGSDRQSDIAVVRLSNRTLPQARLAPIKSAQKDLAIGEWAIAIGNPFAQANTVTVGVVSAVGRTIPVPGGRDGRGFQLTDMIQTDAAINPGNSGGPLCNIKGEVIGINTAIIPFGTGLGFTIPINKAMSVADQLIKTGDVKHPYVGISMLPISDDIQKEFGLPDKKGTLVNGVEPGSPAAKGGLRQGDVIRSLNGKPVESSKEVQDLVGTKKVGESLTLEVLRNNTVKKTIKVVIGDRPE